MKKSPISHFGRLPLAAPGTARKAAGRASRWAQLSGSDEPDLPGANAPASEVVGLNVNADVTDPTTTFIFSTPEPGSLPLLANGAAVSFAAWRLRRQTAAHAA